MKFVKLKKLLFIILILALLLPCSVSAFAVSAFTSDNEVKTPEFISENEAQAVVLAHAGVEAENAFFLKTKLDEKKKIYEIKFICDDDKYEYEINAIDGSVLDYEWDIENDEHYTSPTEPNQSSDYRNNIWSSEESALANLGIAREDAKYINSYVRYDEYHNAYAIHVEIGIYDRAISSQTVVYSFDFNMDGEIIERPVPVEPVNPNIPESEQPVKPEQPAPVEPVNPNVPETEQPMKPEQSAPVEPVNPNVPETEQPVKPEQSDYSNILHAAEESTLVELGITRENAKYINSYVKYNGSHVACAIHVEVGIYDKAVSPQTIVYRFEFNMNGEIIEQPDLVYPKPVVSVTPAEPDELDKNDSKESKQSEDTKVDKKKTSTKSSKDNKTNAK